MTLDVNSLQFAYNGRSVLEQLDFQLAPGEIMAVLGVNGAGKSTLLKCINRILRPEGRVVLAGKDLANMSAGDLARRFGYVPQHANGESLTVFDAVLLGRKPHIKWNARKYDLQVVERVLLMMELGELAQRPVDRLSGGERQKVLIARALAQEPAVLLLDEPTSSLDLRNQIQVMNLVARVVREEGISALVSIHDINLALQYADLHLFLKAGRIHALSRMEEVTPEMVQDVYGVKVIIHRVLDQMVVVPLETVIPAP
jgi:iron complex transport system ATP-binding protein